MKKIVIASRDSALAVAQSETLLRHLRERHPEGEISLLLMKTRGDRILNRTLAEIGGKGLFVEELYAAMREGRADFAVHSLKDLPMDLPEDLPLLCVSEREDPRDCLVLRSGLSGPFPGMVVGTASRRRAVQLIRLFPDAGIRPVRGNVQTRLKKLDAGEYDALVLAAAGLLRLGLKERISRFFTVGEMLPAAGQGILAVQGRSDADRRFLQGYESIPAMQAARAERAFVRALAGGCTSPVCACGEVSEDQLTLQGLYCDETGAVFRRGEITGPAEQAEALGAALAARLREEAETARLREEAETVRPRPDAESGGPETGNEAAP